MKTEFVKFLVEEAVPLIRAGKATFEDIVLKFKAQFGREPEGAESIAIRKEFTKPSTKRRRVIQKAQYIQKLRDKDNEWLICIIKIDYVYLQCKM